MNFSLNFIPLKHRGFVETVFKLCPDLILCATFAQNSITFYSLPLMFPRLISVIKKHFNFQMIVDFSASDYPQRPARFSIFVLFRPFLPCAPSFLPLDLTIIVCTQTSESVPIPSISNLFPSMLWPEREIWDLFGVFFSDHPDLRRLLLDYGFQGHPFRKDFPLSGFSEVRYDESLQRVVCEPIELAQEYRHFDFLSPWTPLQ